MLALALPAHQIAGEGEEGRVDGDPGEEDAEVEPEPGMQVEEDLVLGFDDWVGKEGRRGLEGMLGCGILRRKEKGGAYRDAGARHNPIYTIRAINPSCRIRSRRW